MNSMKQIIRKCHVRTFLVPGLLMLNLAAAAESVHWQNNGAVLDLETLVEAAQQNDPWLSGNRHTQEAVESLSVAADSLPDPRMSIGLANLATDTFDFNQEAMTQFNVGIVQSFPRGDSLAIKKRQLTLVGSQYPYLREDHRAKITMSTSQLWLDAYQAQESIALIEANMNLFEQLVDVAEASYSAALGRTRQQDVIRAQLELATLDDRLITFRQQQEMLLQTLTQWLSDYFLDQYTSSQQSGSILQISKLSLAKELPDIRLINPEMSLSLTEIDPQALYENFSTHPVVKAMEQKISASSTSIELAKQKYKPEWGLTANYGYRDSNPMGVDRADLLSIGISFDLPLFTSNRQDKEVQSAMSQTEAVKTEKWQLIRELIATFETNRAQLARLNERQALYRAELIPQMHEQAEAALTAYTNDDGDFAEVVRARIAELNANITALGIDVQRQKAIIRLNYYFVTDVGEMISRNDQTEDLIKEEK